MSRRLCAAILLVTLPVALETSGQADGARSRVALVRSSSSDPVLREASTRVRAELIDAGFEVVEVDRAPGDPRSEVEDAAPTTASFATVAMNRAPNGAFADVWISDHLTGKTVVRRIEVGAGPNATAVLAIRALELLRASLLEVAAKGPPSEPPMAAPTDVMKWIAPALPPAPAIPLLQGNALGLGAHGAAETFPDRRGEIDADVARGQAFFAWFGGVGLAGVELRSTGIEAGIPVGREADGDSADLVAGAELNGVGDSLVMADQRGGAECAGENDPHGGLHRVVAPARLLPGLGHGCWHYNIAATAIALTRMR